LKVFSFLLLFTKRAQIWQRNWIRAEYLPQHEDTAWYRIYSGRNDEAYLTVTSLTVASFETLLLEFSKHYKINNQTRKGGRPRRMIDKHCVLALLLCYYTDKMGYKTLTHFFGIPMTTLSRYINDAERALLVTLKSMPEASIKWPSLEENAYGVF